MIGILGEGLFHSHGDKWRRLRHLLTPSFTSGKLRKVFILCQVNIFITNHSLYMQDIYILISFVLKYRLAFSLLIILVLDDSFY